MHSALHLLCWLAKQQYWSTVKVYFLCAKNSVGKTSWTHWETELISIKKLMSNQKFTVGKIIAKTVCEAWNYGFILWSQCGQLSFDIAVIIKFWYNQHSISRLHHNDCAVYFCRSRVATCCWHFLATTYVVRAMWRDTWVTWATLWLTFRRCWTSMTTPSLTSPSTSVMASNWRQ